MPRSRTRKLTKGQRIKGAMKRAATYTANRDAVMPIYERATAPQDYPPRSAAWAAESQQHRERLVSEWNGGIRDGRSYERRRDGSLRVIAKPRSRVKRLREEQVAQ